MLRSKLLVLLLLVNTLICAEIVGVPHFNYSIYPPIGWKLQPYTTAAELSWLSRDMDVACSVTAYDGSSYQTVEEMFKTLSREYHGQGEFFSFVYQGMEALLGEVEFKIADRVHKGWLLFLEGDEFDYHLNAFSLLESYEVSQSKILSVIDSFAYGESGALGFGPVSTFLHSSENKQVLTYPIDFFNQTINISSSEYDFTNAQTIIEREADIMKDYSEDPTNFYSAWKRYYKLIFRDNYSRLEPLFQELNRYLGQDMFSDYQRAEYLMLWLHSFQYDRLGGQSDLLNPLASCTSQTGDCDARSLIMGILLHKFGIESILLTSEKVKHAMIAVKIPGEGVKYSYDGDDYLRIELTKKALMGEIPENLVDESLWTVVEMEYTHGF